MPTPAPDESAAASPSSRHPIGIRLLRRLIFGKPLPTSRLAAERLPKLLALPIFASDALSSNAYAPEAILAVLVTGAAGLAALNFAVPIALAVAALMAIVVISYRQIAFAYPDGGGAYPVARENLGAVPALVAAASLLVDYVLTVATSVAAGVAAMITAFPALQPHLEALCQIAILLIMLANLRGIRVAGWWFAWPTYVFMAAIIVTVGAGAAGLLTHASYLQAAAHAGSHLHAMPATAHAVGWYLLLRAFSMGCAALTGVDAISNTVPMFREPSARNAANTTGIMGVVAIVMFVGLTLVAWMLGVVPMPQTQPHYETVVGQIGEIVWSPHGLHWMFYVVQFSTSLILVIAANTGFAGFPQLASLLALDGYLPRQLANVGDRLAYSNGIMVLAVAAMLLVHIFGGIVGALLSLYAIGVFVSITLAQVGMVRRWMRVRAEGTAAPRSLAKLTVAAVGALATGIVAVIIGISKFDAGPVISSALFVPRLFVGGRVYGPYSPHYGAWLVVLVVPVLVMMFQAIHRHYHAMRIELSLDRAESVPPIQPDRNTVLVLVPRVHRGVLDALGYARLTGSDVRGVYVEVDPAATPALKSEWERWAPDIPLLILESPFRSLVSPILEYIAAVQAERGDDYVTVIVPELVPRQWWQRILHNRAGPLLRSALAGRQDVVVTNVRYFLKG